MHWVSRNLDCPPYKTDTIRITIRWGFRVKLNASSKNLAFYRTSSLGDVILSSRVLTSLHNAYPSVHVLWFTSAIATNILREKFPWVQFFAVQDSKEVAEILHAENFEGAFIDLQKNPRSARTSALVRSHAKSIKIVKINKRRLFRRLKVLSARIFGRSKNYSKPTSIVTQLDLVFDVVNRALKEINHEPIKPILHLVPKIPAQRKKEKQIAFAPQAGFETKSIPKTYFTKIVEKLDTMAPNEIRFVLVGCEDGSGYEAVFAKLKRNTAIIPTTQPIAKTYQTLGNSAILVSADSAPMHIAELLGTPCAAFFGPTVADFGFEPSLTSSKLFESKIGCRPCSLHGKKKCRYDDNACFDEKNIEKAIHFILKKIQEV